MAWEIVGRPEGVTIQIACGASDRDVVYQQLQAHFPEVLLVEEADALSSGWTKQEGLSQVIVDFGLSQEFLFPLQTLPSLKADPLIGLVGSLSGLGEGEAGALQIIFQKTAYPWAECARWAVTEPGLKPLFADDRELVSQAEEKISRPLYAVVIRAAARSPREGRAWQIVKGLGAALTQLASPARNELIPLTNDGYLTEHHEHDLLQRETRRSGMILNSEELVALVHLPTVSIPRLESKAGKTKAAPPIALGQETVLGMNAHGGREIPVTLGSREKRQHIYMVGASGTGKSTLLLNLIVQDIEKGRGVAVLDPHGDLIDQVLGYVPESRLADVVLFDPADEEHPIGFNILSARSETEKNVLASDLVNVFRRLSTSWGDQMTSVLGNAILAILESERGGTLADLRRFLVEPGYRQEFLKTVRDPHVVYYWQKEFPLLQGRPQASILTRLDTFLRPKLIRHMVVQKENRLDLGQVLNQGKIFLGKLAQGTIGEENSYLLGSLLVSKFHQLAMSRQEIPEPERKDFFLYIDEFHNFITPSMSAILSGARKYHLGLVLAHQELRQLLDRDPGVASAVLANAATRICFRVGDFDAHKLADGFAYFDAKDLQNLGVGEAIGRIERPEQDFNLKTKPLPAVEAETAQARREKIRAMSREKYATPRSQIAALVQLPAETPAPIPTSTPAEQQEAIRKPEPAVKSTQPRQPRAPVPEPHLLGRGGQQHTYLQNLIKKLAEAKGFRAIIEKPVLNGTGNVDVSLEKDGQPIVACEVSVTTSPDHEVGNLEKCLKAGFEKIILVSPERKTLNKVRELAAAKWSEPESGRLHFCSPEELVDFLDELGAQAASTEATVRGYKVKTSFRSPSDQEPRKQAVAQTILGALRRLKGK